MPSGLAFSVRREVRFYEPVTTAWCIAGSRQFYGITVTSSYSRGSSYQRSSGGSQAAPSVCAESSTIPWAPTPAVLPWEGYDKGAWDDPQRRILAAQSEEDVQCPHPAGPGVCLKPSHLWLLFSSTFAFRRLLMLVDFYIREGLTELWRLMDLFLVTQEVRGTTRKAQLSTPATH